MIKYARLILNKKQRILKWSGRIGNILSIIFAVLEWQEILASTNFILSLVAQILALLAVIFIEEFPDNFDLLFDKISNKIDNMDDGEEREQYITVRNNIQVVYKNHPI